MKRIDSLDANKLFVHGFHVLVGTIAIAVGFVRVALYHTTSTHHVGLEASILYWHFVDVVWLALYMVIYWWGAALNLDPNSTTRPPTSPFFLFY